MRNLTSAIKISQHNANSAFYTILDRKRVPTNNLLEKVDIYQYYNQNGTKLSSMDRIAQLTEKKNWKRNAIKRNKFWRL